MTDTALAVSRLRTFGSARAYWSEASDLPLVACDLQTIAEAIAHCIHLRREGIAFASHIEIPDPLASFAWFSAAPTILNGVTDYDQRSHFFDALAVGSLVLGGRNQGELIRPDPKRLRAALEFLTLGDTVVFRSRREADLTSRLLGFCPRRDAIFPSTQTRAPSPAVRPDLLRDTLVVWASHLSAEQVGFLAFALEELRHPVVIIAAVAKAGQVHGLRAQVVPVQDAVHWLTRALAIVDSSLTDPSCALTLSAWGAPMAVSFTSGAAEFLTGAVSYQPAHSRSVLRAALEVLGLASPTPPISQNSPPLQASVKQAFGAGLSLDGPLVTIVVPTYNRRKFLERALQSLARQIYRNVEILVVNDGGEAIDDLVASVARARLVNLPSNVGVNAAANIGLHHALGTYLMYCGDDDDIFPDAVARFVSVLETGGGSIANATCAYSWSRVDGDDNLTVDGYSVFSTDAVIPTDLLISNRLSGPATFVRREALVAIGGLDASSGHCSDYEAWLKLSFTSDIVHIDRVLGMANSRVGGKQVANVTGREYAQKYRLIYARTPLDRPAVNAARDKQLASFELDPDPPAATRPSVAIGQPS